MKDCEIARHLLLELLTRTGMPAGSEFLDMITPQYIADLVSWGAIARARRRVKFTGSLLPVCLARLDSKTAPMAMSELRWMRSARHRRRIISFR